ncbi:MAG: Flp pilus assembly complex ATPase component TadA [Candidatus Omnitrophica bacterium]|nr:Flp pilus assembly complex ATPase component TadA [Candidatus Omnitrophota bacterium]
MKEALNTEKEKGGELSQILIEKGLISEKELVVLVGKELKIPSINLSKLKIDPLVSGLIPERIARKYQLIPISKFGKILTVAMVDPLNIMALDDLKILTGCDIDVVMAGRQDLKDAMEKGYPGKETLWKEVLESAGEEELEVVKTGEVSKTTAEESEEAPIVKMVDIILAEAIKRRASDIHIEPREKTLRVRYRIDGNLEDAFTLPKKNQNAFLTRLKIMSGLDITEFRLPQDGRFKTRFEGKEIDYRVSMLPIQHGNKVVLRLLDKSNLSVGLDKLGFLAKELEVFKIAIRRPYGMILITGPTGSGKSTTLYSILNQLNTPERNIMTIEDPVEYLVDGITQLQVKQEIGLTFAAGLRSILRQSPDIIMVGEIRDSETADIAVKASLTGHLVLSTLHTNDATGAITRLIDMGVEPFLVSSALILVAAQRLCRRLCPHCKEVVNIVPDVLKKAGWEKESIPEHGYQGRGCRECRFTGYTGRMGLLEVFLMDDEIRQMVINGSSIEDIRKDVLNKGMKTLRQNALEAFVNGGTSLEEVLRVTGKE